MKFKWIKKIETFSCHSSILNKKLTFEYPCYFYEDKINNIRYEYLPSLKSLCEGDNIKIYDYGDENITYTYDYLMKECHFKDDDIYSRNYFIMYELSIYKFDYSEDKYIAHLTSQDKNSLISNLSFWIKENFTDNNYIGEYK